MIRPMQQATADGPTSLEWFTAVVAAVSALAAFAAAVAGAIPGCHPFGVPPENTSTNSPT